MDNAKSTLSDVLRQCVRESGMSINSIAKGSGVPQPALHWFMHGERDLKVATVQKLAAYFGLKFQEAAESLAELLDLDFIPASQNEGGWAYFDHIWEMMVETERRDLEHANSMWQLADQLTEEGYEDQAKICRRIAQRYADSAARLREHRLTKLEPHRAAARQQIAKARTKARKEGRTRRRSASRN